MKSIHTVLLIPNIKRDLLHRFNSALISFLFSAINCIFPNQLNSVVFFLVKSLIIILKWFFISKTTTNIFAIIVVNVVRWQLLKPNWIEKTQLKWERKFYWPFRYQSICCLNIIRNLFSLPKIRTYLDDILLTTYSNVYRKKSGQYLWMQQLLFRRNSTWLWCYAKEVSVFPSAQSHCHVWSVLLGSALTFSECVIFRFLFSHATETTKMSLSLTICLLNRFDSLLSFLHQLAICS